MTTKQRRSKDVLTGKIPLIIWVKEPKPRSPPKPAPRERSHRSSPDVILGDSPNFVNVPRRKRR